MSPDKQGRFGYICILSSDCVQYTCQVMSIYERHCVDMDRCFMIYGIHLHRPVIDKVRQRTTNYQFKAVMTQAYQRSQSGVPSFMVQPFHNDQDGGCIVMETRVVDEVHRWGLIELSSVITAAPRSSPTITGH